MAKKNDIESIPAHHPGLTQNLCGQEAAEQAFLASWNAKRPHHALLLHGASGIGKATLGYRIARFVLNEAKNNDGFLGAGLLADQDMDATGLAIQEESPLFHQLVAGAHSDFRLITPLPDKAQISIEQIRDLVRFSQFTSGRGGWRVVLIDKIDDLTIAAANSLLKLLEEPPANTMLILIADHLGKLLPTIRSRCRRIALSPLNDAHMQALLERFDNNEQNADYPRIIQHSHGSIGFALQVLGENGMELYQMILNILINSGANNFIARKELAKMMIGKSGKFKMMGVLLLRFMDKVILAHASNQKPPFDDMELKVAQILCTQYGLHGLMEKRDQWREWINKFGAPSHLDGAHLTHMLFS